MKKLILAAAVVVVSGCMAHAPETALRLERSTYMIRQADELGARRNPLARAHLERARQEQEAARQLHNQRDARAYSLVMCSEADAELAVALAREAQLHKAAIKAQDEVAALKWTEEQP